MRGMTTALDPLTGDTRLVAPDRAARLTHRSHDCPFCAGQETDTPRETGRIDDATGAWRARSFPNLFPLTEPHEVLVPTPRHVTSWHAVELGELTAALDLLLERRAALAEPGRYVHAFVNDGVAAGASIPHVHAQLVVVDAAHGDRLVHGVHAGSCTLCALLADSAQPLLITLDEGLALLAHPAPRIGGGLLITPTTHTATFDVIDTAVLARMLHRALRAIDDAVALNLWLVAHGGDTHWYLEVQPRSAGIAGVELALGIHVIAQEPEVTVRTAHERLRLRADVES